MSTQKAVDDHIEALRRESQMDTHREALASLASQLAAFLDGGEPRMMTASWARELRQTLIALKTEDAGDVDDDAWLADLPPAVRDAKD